MKTAKTYKISRPAKVLIAVTAVSVLGLVALLSPLAWDSGPVGVICVMGLPGLGGVVTHLIVTVDDLLQRLNDQREQEEAANTTQ